MEDIQKLEQKNNIETNVFEATSVNDFSLVFTNSNYYEKSIIDLLVYKNFFWLITNLHKIFERNQMNTHFCTRSFNTYGSGV